MAIVSFTSVALKVPAGTVYGTVRPTVAVMVRVALYHEVGWPGEVVTSVAAVDASHMSFATRGNRNGSGGSYVMVDV
jgi:hypothetical protein